MQTENETSDTFLRRTDSLAQKMGINLEDLPEQMKVSRASLFGYRNGSRAISKKAWLKLEELEKRENVGLGGYLSELADTSAFVKELDVNQEIQEQILDYVLNERRIIKRRNEQLVESLNETRVRLGEAIMTLTQELSSTKVQKMNFDNASESEIPEIKHLPAHIYAAAGSPISADVVDWGEGDTLLRVKIVGASMSPLFEDGDVVEMRPKAESRSPFMKKGLIYLLEYDGGYTVKRYNTRAAREDEEGEEWVERGRVKVLESENKIFSEIVIRQPLEWVAWWDEK